MAQRFTDPEPIRKRIKDLGLSEAEVARRIGLTRNKFWLSLKGQRDFSFQEAKQLAGAIEMDFADVLLAFGIEYADPDQYLIRIHGYIVDGDAVDMSYRGLDGGLDEINAPFSGWLGLAFRFRTQSYAPRFLAGEVIGVDMLWDTDNDKLPIQRWMGREVVVMYKSDRGVEVTFKRLQEGSQAGRYTFLSLNPAAPPLLDIEPGLIGLVSWHLTQSEFSADDLKFGRRRLNDETEKYARFYQMAVTQRAKWGVEGWDDMPIPAKYLNYTKKIFKKK